MSDTREALTRLLMDWGCDDESAGQCAGEILAEFLVVPRSEARTEYGVQFRSMVFGTMKDADVARHRAVHMYETTPDAVRHRQVWESEWAHPEEGQ